MSDIVPVASNEYFIAVGKVAAQWAVFQAIVDEAIMVLADVDTESGLCLTAQISSMPAKTSALMSLLDRRKCPDNLHREMSNLMGRAKEPSSLRNEIVHGVLRIHVSDNAVRRHTTKAKAKFHVKIEDTDPHPVLTLLYQISALTKEFLDLFNRIQPLLPSSP